MRRTNKPEQISSGKSVSLAGISHPMGYHNGRIHGYFGPSRFFVIFFIIQATDIKRTSDNRLINVVQHFPHHVNRRPNVSRTPGFQGWTGHPIYKPTTVN